MEKRLRDIIKIASVKLVIELEDADNDPSGIINNFVFTENLIECVRSILNSIKDGKGCGVFIKGNYGSGKSHLLSYLYLILKNGNLPIMPEFNRIGREIRVIKIPLVKYPASLSLEEIVLSNFAYNGKVFNRDALYREILNQETAIIIDELSEFLRSKKTPSAFYEDIRFLQFLGEFSFTHPFWIIASLQEWIEETGHISSSIFNRIKDRFSLRITLTTSHIEDIIDKRIIIKGAETETIIRDIFNELKRYYPHLSLKYDEFRKTFPLHPYTVRFLSGLSPVFSQHRGVIQFVHNATKGMLDESADTLITPEIIFDHFEERIREIPEYSKLARGVYDYYKIHVRNILLSENQCQMALLAIKIMILAEISPLEKRKTYKEISEILLRKISTINSRINYEFMRDGVLEPLVNHKMYVVRDNDTYYIDPSIDEGIKIKARIKSIQEKFEDRNYLFNEIVNNIYLPYLPLRDILHGKRYKFIWQNTSRECIANIIFSEELRGDEIERILDSLKRSVDGYLAIFSLFCCERTKIVAYKEAYKSPLLKSILFWLPRAIKADELEFIELFIAKRKLLDEFPEIEDESKRDEAKAREILSSLYFEGEIIYGEGETEKELKGIGYLPLEKMMSHLFEQPLGELHPNHYRIMPRVEFFSSFHLSNLFTHYIKAGKIAVDDAEKKGIIPYIKGLLEPMGIVNKRGNTFFIHVDAENELVSHLLSLISHEERISEIKRVLKKGKWGICDRQLNLLISILIASGNIVPYRAGEIVDLTNIEELERGEIESIKEGRILSPRLLGYVKSGKFLWGDVEDIPTPITQKNMWKAVQDKIRTMGLLAKETSLLIARYSEYSIFKRINIDNHSLNRVNILLNSITHNMPPSGAIERILSHLAENPDLERDFVYFESIHRFLSLAFQTINKYHIYLSNPSLKFSGKNAEELNQEKSNMLISLDDFLLHPDREFSKINEEWERFYEEFCGKYKLSHEQYYNSPIFMIRKSIQESEECRLLKRMAMEVPSILFECDWFSIKRELDLLLDACHYDLNQELFINPICRCGYKIGDEPPLVEVDYREKTKRGIINFICELKRADYRERIESYIHSIIALGKGEIADKISKLLTLDPDRLNLSLLFPLLTDEILKEIGNAIKGKWKINEKDITELVKDISGRRIRYSDLKNILLKWLGDEEETIVWVKGNDDREGLSLNMAKYGIAGERFACEIDGNYTEDEIENLIIERGMIDNIGWHRFNLRELVNLLNDERILSLKKRIREEIFNRVFLKNHPDELSKTVKDDTLQDILFINRLAFLNINEQDATLFTNVISPMSLILERLKYRNELGLELSSVVIEMMEKRFENLINTYNASAKRFEGLKDISYIKDKINGVVVIMDALRLDLWYILRDELIKDGFVINDTPFIIKAPSTTFEFRKSLGIEDIGTIGGKSYTLLKWAERGVGKRVFSEFLKTGSDIKFLHFNFIDTKIHASSLNLYPLFATIKSEFKEGIIPVLRGIKSFLLLADHGFCDKKRLKERYVHGGNSIWELILPFSEIKYSR